MLFPSSSFFSIFSFPSEQNRYRQQSRVRRPILSALSFIALYVVAAAASVADRGVHSGRVRRGGYGGEDQI